MIIKLRRTFSIGKVIAIVGVAFLSVVGVAQSVPPLINYQGRLTDQTGAPLAAGLYALQFRLWDSPTATNATDLIWDQQQSVTVQSNGVFNVILGSPGGSSIPGITPQVNNLAYAFNGSNCFLGITVTTSNSVPVTIPTEILPRQQLLSVPYAIQSQQSQQAQQAQVASSVAPGSIVNASLAAGSVTLNNFAARQVGTNVGVGGVAMSTSSGSSPGASSILLVTIVTTGRPVIISLMPDNSGSGSSIGSASTQGATAVGNTSYTIYRDQIVIGACNVVIGGNDTGIAIPPSALQTIDVPPPGIHTYSIKSQEQSGIPANGYTLNAILVAYEL